MPNARGPSPRGGTQAATGEIAGYSVHISTGAGEFDCWHVAVKGAGIDETYWVAKDTHDIIRTREPIGGQGAMLQLDLLSRHRNNSRRWTTPDSVARGIDSLPTMHDCSGPRVSAAAR